MVPRAVATIAGEGREGVGRIGEHPQIDVVADSRAAMARFSSNKMSKVPTTSRLGGSPRRAP